MAGPARPQANVHMKSIVWALMVCGSVMAAGCGQKGPLYLPDKNASVVTSPAGSTTKPPSSTPQGTTTPQHDKSDDDSQSSSPKPKS